MTARQTSSQSWRPQLVAAACAFVGVVAPAWFVWQELQGSAETVTTSGFGAWSLTVGAAIAMILLVGLLLARGRAAYGGLLAGVLLAVLAIVVALVAEAASAGS